MMKGLVAVIIVATISVWPVVVRPNRIADVGTDGVLLVWIFNQNKKNITGLLRVENGGMSQLFNGDIFYPYKYVLAYSDMFYLSSLLGWVIQIGTDVMTSGRIMWVGQMMTMGVVYWWWYKMTGRVGAAMVGATALGLSRIRWEYQVHLQMWSMQWWLLGVMLWWLWSKERKTWQWMGAGIIMGLQVWESLLPVFFAAAAMGTISIFYAVKNGWRKILGTATKMVLVAGLIALPVLAAYGRVASEFKYQRSIREAANNSMSIDELATKFASPGLYVVLTVAILAMKGKVKDKNVRWLAVLVVVGVVMAAGPVVKWDGKTVKIGNKIPIPLPYAATYYAVPGFGALRTPSRWMWVAAWAGSGLIAIGLATMGSKRGKYLMGVAGAMGVVIVGGSGAKGWVELPRQDQIPAVDKWLAKQSGKVVMELPIGNEHREKWRMWYNLYNDKTLVNGFSGFTPPEWEDKTVQVNEKCLGKEDKQWMEKRKIDYVVIHFDEWPEAEEKCRNWLAEEKGKIEWQDENTVVVSR